MGNVSQTDWAGFFGFVICACVIVAGPSVFAFKTLNED
jgi:hypothetical protein